MSKAFEISLAPQKLWQAINPLTFYQQGVQVGLINIGQTPQPKMEQAILDEVGSYGRQLGRIGDALEVLMKHVDRETLSAPERDVLDILQGQLAEIRRTKRALQDNDPGESGKSGGASAGDS
ncbi:hypothetical protein [Methylocapsa palsarum]|uniref:Uncharacterized protein n=1 Tax=Methylocapsa palsarum TaxID=1612308 RepID=A0A1I4BDZ8_9HYPH|nr:hypothetical protein [Methylocapsa palsarum]SFK66743.1 hypothetical protein SAMN05444581_11464 [Methylocapsa palsarum]